MFIHEAIEHGELVALQGQINSGNAAEAESELMAVLDRGASRLVLDCTALNYISSAGLRVVLMLAKRSRGSAAKLVLFGMQPSVQEVFSISGFLGILQVVDSREAALLLAAS